MTYREAVWVATSPEFKPNCQRIEALRELARHAARLESIAAKIATLPLEPCGRCLIPLDEIADEAANVIVNLISESNEEL